MAFIQYINSTEIVEALVLPISENIVRITSDVTPLFEGFYLFLDKEGNYPLDKGEYAEYKTLYRVGEGWYELSNDGSVYKDPLEVIPEELSEEQKAELEKRKQIADISSQISSLKMLISDTDYQIIKTYEYSLVGKESEYDIESLHKERQALRDKINELEEQLAELTVEPTTE